MHVNYLIEQKMLQKLRWRNEANQNATNEVINIWMHFKLKNWFPMKKKKLRSCHYVFFPLVSLTNKTDEEKNNQWINDDVSTMIHIWLS